jgi:hypothetical protein
MTSEEGLGVYRLNSFLEILFGNSTRPDVILVQPTRTRFGPITKSPRPRVPRRAGVVDSGRPGAGPQLHLGRAVQVDPIQPALKAP